MKKNPMDPLTGIYRTSDEYYIIGLCFTIYSTRALYKKKKKKKKKKYPDVCLFIGVGRFLFSACLK